MSSDRALKRIQGVLTGNSTSSVSVGTSETTIATLLGVPGIYRIGVKNTGANALNSFKIVGRNITGGTWEDIVTTSTEFTTIPSNVNGFLLSSSSSVSPTTLASNATWHGTIDTKYFYEVAIVATVASSTTTLTVQIS